ncbi:MAG: type II secretion system F family protein [Eubacteriales bacterium]|nr:type II secretion system F family protein [Eubacteriales bacterium]
MYLWVGTFCFSIVLFCGFTQLLKKIVGKKLSVRKRLWTYLYEKKDEKKGKKKETKNCEGPLKRLMFFVNKNYKDRLEDQLYLAGIALRAEEYLAIWVLAITAIPSLLLLFHRSLIVCLGFAILGLFIPPLILTIYTKKRRSLFHSQLADALTVMCNSLQTGFSLQASLKSIADEMPDPIGKEFSGMVGEIQLGMPLEESLARMVRRTECEDLELLAATISIQRQTGGNLSEIMDTISHTIKERIGIANEIKLLTTTGRTSGYVIGLLPVFILAILMILNPDYVSLFFETRMGKIMLAVAGGMELVGFLAVKKVVAIKY